MRAASIGFCMHRRCAADIGRIRCRCAPAVPGLRRRHRSCCTGDRARCPRPDKETALGSRSHGCIRGVREPPTEPRRRQGGGRGLRLQRLSTHHHDRQPPSRQPDIPRAGDQNGSVQTHGPRPHHERRPVPAAAPRLVVVPARTVYRRPAAHLALVAASMRTAMPVRAAAGASSVALTCHFPRIEKRRPCCF